MRGVLTARSGTMRGVLVAQHGTLRGTVKSTASIIGSLRTTAIIRGRVCMTTPIVMPDAQDVYEGGYDVTPKVTEQIMPTASKYMTDNVTIRKIPVFKVHNNSGGTTVYIATEDL